MDAYRVLQVAPDCEDEVIHGAYRALALKYHPDRDGTQYAAKRMSDLNLAYALVRDRQARARHDTARKRAMLPAETAIGPGPAPMPPPRSMAAGTRLSHGRYSGWTLRDLARQDPDYLRWLSRHSSGIRYRTEIYQILSKQEPSVA
ncbi:MAG TPA: DnaJ domain-containing protein [Candidatus Limnocylindria bacterium]|nr:DnaJ domain-containing protein [Candidatus Limnocylindria bacterium]